MYHFWMSHVSLVLPVNLLHQQSPLYCKLDVFPPLVPCLPSMISLNVQLNLNPELQTMIWGLTNRGERVGLNGGEGSEWR